jgi:hypothetical protein
MAVMKVLEVVLVILVLLILLFLLFLLVRCPMALSDWKMAVLVRSDLMALLLSRIHCLAAIIVHAPRTVQRLLHVTQDTLPIGRVELQYRTFQHQLTVEWI